jgi:DNA-binding response OmpR family regulator
LNGDGVDIVTQELETTGYRVLHAPDGLAALELHATHRPDLVILDWMLPKLDGLAVLTRLRSSSAVPVLMLTDRGEEIDRVIGLEVGADDYLTKPFSMRELIARFVLLNIAIASLKRIQFDTVVYGRYNEQR